MWLEYNVMEVLCTCIAQYMHVHIHCTCTGTYSVRVHCMYRYMTYCTHVVLHVHVIE